MEVCGKKKVINHGKHTQCLWCGETVKKGLAKAVRKDKQVLTDVAYHATQALSKSALKKWTIKCPSIFWQNTPLNPEYKPLESTEGLILGKLNHCLLLEPNKFNKDFIVKDDMPTKTRGVAWKTVQAEYKQTIITPYEYEAAKKRIKALLGYGSINEMLKGAKYEQPYFWHDKEWDIPCKGKLDIIRNTKQGIVIFDYKTTGKMETVLRSLDKENLHFDVGMYARMCKAKFGQPLAQFVFLFQSNKKGEEYYIEPKTVQGIDLELCETAVDLVGKEISRRYHDWKGGNKTAWNTDVKATPFNSMSEFYWEREVEILKSEEEHDD